MLAARSYNDSVADRDTICEGVIPQGQARRTSLLIASTMCSKRKQGFLMANLKRKQAEKHEQAAMCLAEQKHEIAILI